LHTPATAVLDFAAIFDVTPSPYLVLAADFSIVSVNRAYLQATSTMHEDIIGRHIFDVFPDNPDDPAATGVANLGASLRRVLQTKCADTMAIQKYDILVASPDGMTFEERHWSPINTPVLNADGEVTHIVHRVEDVTDFVRARDRSARMASTIDDQALEIEAANRRLREANDKLEIRVAARTEEQRLTEVKLRASEKRFRLMADAIPQIVWIVDGNGRAVYFNKQWSTYTGISPDGMAPEEVSIDFVHPDDREKTVQAWEHARQHGHSFSVEHRMRSASGEYRWFLVRAELFRDSQPDGADLWFGTSTDVHDRKLAEAALRKSEERYRSLFETIDQGFCLIDDDFRRQRPSLRLSLLRRQSRVSSSRPGWSTSSERPCGRTGAAT
jgi:PAS domain S-box-containing protein